MTARRRRILLAACCLAGGALGYLLSGTGDSHHQVIFTLESSVSTETQLFYDVGRGFNENDSIKKVVYQANTPVVLDFELSGPNLAGLRFDPSRSPAKIKIHEILLLYQDEKSFAVPLDSLTAAKDIQSLRYDGRMLILETVDAAQDPILYLTQLGPAPRVTLLRITARILAGAVIALGMAFFVVWVYRSANREQV
jgi:hypothetical protein